MTRASPELGPCAGYCQVALTGDSFGICTLYPALIFPALTSTCSRKAWTGRGQHVLEQLKGFCIISPQNKETPHTFFLFTFYILSITFFKPVKKKRRTGRIWFIEVFDLAYIVFTFI